MHEGKGGGPGDPRFAVVNWIAIIHQLSSTRANRILEAADLPFPQFTILLHFGGQPGRIATVSQVAAAFQQPQPGITKTLQKLEEKAFLTASPHPTDGRAKLFQITDSGRAELAKSKALIAPLLDWLFEDWNQDDLAVLFSGLNRLKVKLDESRE
jgi:DNA-binding MarR family transcriptional regulator